MKIKISEIAILERQRKELDKTKLNELAESIKTNGLLHPIVIRRPFDEEITQISESQRYILSVGGRRLAAHILLGRTDIEANLKEDLDPISAQVVELEENIKRHDLSWQEQISAREKIHELRLKQNPAQTVTDTAKELGLTPQQLYRDVSLAQQVRADPSLKGATTKGSAVRLADHKEHVSKRAAIASSALGSDLGNKLYTADGRDFIRTIPSQSVDLVFSDLPYGIDYFEGAKSGENMKGQYDDSADSAKDFIADVVPHMVRVVKPTGWIVLFMCYEWHDWLQTQLRTACRTHGEYEVEGDLRKQFDGKRHGMGHCMGDLSGVTCSFLRPELPPWIWTRRGKGNYGHWPELHASNRYEMIVAVNGGSAKLMKTPKYPHENVLDFEPFSGERLHAMQKPHALCREIIDRTTVVGERVLDICFGSGAHLAAAADMGRDFIGCDRNPDNLASALSLVGQYYHKAGK